MKDAKLPALLLWACLPSLVWSGCSVFGNSGVEIAPYEILEKENALELRHYERLVLATTAMPNGMQEQRDPFRKLFDYISGKNVSRTEIPMTAPVLLEQAGQNTESMAFVLPKSFSIEQNRRRAALRPQGRGRRLHRPSGRLGGLVHGPRRHDPRGTGHPQPAQARTRGGLQDRVL